jgi:hypothetical protein
MEVLKVGDVVIGTLTNVPLGGSGYGFLRVDGCNTDTFVLGNAFGSEPGYWRVGQRVRGRVGTSRGRLVIEQFCVGEDRA